MNLRFWQDSSLDVCQIKMQCSVACFGLAAHRIARIMAELP